MAGKISATSPRTLLTTRAENLDSHKKKNKIGENDPPRMNITAISIHKYCTSVVRIAFPCLTSDRACRSLSSRLDYLHSKTIIGFITQYRNIYANVR